MVCIAIECHHKSALPFIVLVSFHLQIVHCLACRGSFVAGGVNKPTFESGRRAVDDKSHHSKTKPAVVGTSTPVAKPTPSNKRQRSSTLKAHLAKSLVQQRQLDEGASPKLSTFLTSVQWWSHFYAFMTHTLYPQSVHQYLHTHLLNSLHLLLKGNPCFPNGCPEPPPIMACSVSLINDSGPLGKLLTWQWFIWFL